MDLQNRVVIVTGAVGTIGKGICRELARDGMQVVVADLNKEKIDSFVDEIKSSGGSALGITVDVTSRSSTLKMAQDVMQSFGRIDVLVNNAGVIAVAPLIDFKEEDWDRIINVNLKGAFLCDRKRFRE